MKVTEISRQGSKSLVSLRQISIRDLIILVFLLIAKCDVLENHSQSSVSLLSSKAFVNSELGHQGSGDGNDINETSNKHRPGLNTHINDVKENRPIFPLHSTVPSSSSISLDKEVQKTGNNKGSKNLGFVPLEGGGSSIPFQVPVDLSSTNTTQAKKGLLDDDIPTKGSKGRKGVKYPGSSVARKGVPTGDADVESQQATVSRSDSVIDLGLPLASDGNILTSSESRNDRNGILKDETKTAVLSDIKVNAPSSVRPTQNFQTQETSSRTQSNSSTKGAHSKKPEYASDEGDADESDKYSLIHTSTTGEDYVIIGIVIVIGIWFSVFGGLIFYRRAGEYWDRRHYRRMDFLVEGMYND